MQEGGRVLSSSFLIKTNNLTEMNVGVHEAGPTSVLKGGNEITEQIRKKFPLILGEGDVIPKHSFSDGNQNTHGQRYSQHSEFLRGSKTILCLLLDTKSLGPGTCSAQ